MGKSAAIEAAFSMMILKAVEAGQSASRQVILPRKIFITIRFTHDCLCLIGLRG